MKSTLKLSGGDQKPKKERSNWLMKLDDLTDSLA
jgi:hypothetical protein